MRQESIPFNERGGRLRGCLDAISGRFPRFVFGGGVADDTLPVFHFHDESAGELEPKLRYLAENGYRSITSDDIEAFVAGRGVRDARRVGLCFDDVWASVWTTALPLLKRYGLTAIAFAIPGRIEDAGGCRPSSADGASRIDGPPLATWPELRALHASGFVDVQCHTHSHSRVFCSTIRTGYVTPAYAAVPMLNRPRVADAPTVRFATPQDLGAPLYLSRSRMSDGHRVTFNGDDMRRQCIEHVATHGAAEFFARDGWQRELDAIANRAAPRAESDDARRQAIEEELDQGRAILNDRLGITTVNHVCLPWGVSGDVTSAALKRLGYRTAFANRLRGLHAVRRGDDPHWLKRLPNKYIFRLPGRGRRIWSTTA
ncbi:MAG TPA: polysaccharide deacetylase family protein [Vicinamibacterales bacterium]